MIGSTMQRESIDNSFRPAVLESTVDSPSSSDQPNDAPTHFSAKTYGLIALLGTLAGMGPLAIDLYLPSFPTIAKDLNTSIAAIEQTLSAYFIGLSLGQLIYGPLADRLGRKRPLYFGLALFVLASIGCARTQSVTALVGWRFVQALGGCAEMVIARAIVRDKFEARDAARVFSTLVLVMGLAPILGPLLGGWIVVHLGWRWLFSLLAAFGAACLLAVSTLLPETHAIGKRQKQSPTDILRTGGMLLRNRTFIVHAAGASLGSAAMFAYIGSAAFVFMELFHVSPQHFGLFFGANAAGLIGCAQINGKLVQKLQPAQVLRGAMIVQAIAGASLLAVALTGAGGFVGVLLPLFVLVSCLGFIFPNTTALAMAPHGKVAGNASAILGCLQFGVSGLAGYLVSRLHTGTAVPMASVIAICSISAMGINVLGSPKKD